MSTYMYNVLQPQVPHKSGGWLHNYGFRWLWYTRKRFLKIIMGVAESSQATQSICGWCMPLDTSLFGSCCVVQLAIVLWYSKRTYTLLRLTLPRLSAIPVHLKTVSKCNACVLEKRREGVTQNLPRVLKIDRVLAPIKNAPVCQACGDGSAEGSPGYVILYSKPLTTLQRTLLLLPLGSHCALFTAYT